MTTCEKLATNRVFTGMSPKALEPVCDAGEVMRANAGDRLIEEGQRNTHMYLVLDGEVEVRLRERADRFSGVRLGKRGSGICLGEYSFIDKKPASAAVIVTRPSELFRISYKALEGLLATNDALGRTVYRNLLLQLVDRLRSTDAELDLFRPL